MEEFICDIGDIIIDRLTSNYVLYALRVQLIITKEEFENIGSLDTPSNRRMLLSVLAKKDDSCIDILIEIVESNTCGQKGLVQKLKNARDKLGIFRTNTEASKANEGIWFGNLTIPWNFTGRVNELKSLHDIVLKSRKGQPHNIDAIALICSISGLGGVGKSTLARRYAFVNKDFFDGNIILLRSANQKFLTEDYRNLATYHLNIPEAKYKRLDLLVREIYLWFKDKKSLFIFDNVEDALHIIPFLPNNLPPNATRPYLLVTSRRKDLSVNEINAFVLNVLNESDALELIRTSLPNTDLDKSKELVQTLGYLPLFLQQAISDIKNPSGLNTIELYLKKYEENAKILHDKELKLLYDRTWPKKVTFKITKERVMQECVEVNTDSAYFLVNYIFYCICLNYMKSDNGFGCCECKVASNLLQAVTVIKLLQMNPIKHIEEMDDNYGQVEVTSQLDCYVKLIKFYIIDQLTVAYSPTEYYIKQSSYRILVNLIGCLVSQPFYVMGAGCLGEFVGRREFYSPVLSHLPKIIKNGGSLNLFTAGLFPRFMGDAFHILCVSCLTYFSNDTVQKELSKSKEQRSKIQQEIDEEKEFLIIPRKLIGFSVECVLQDYEENAKPILTIRNFKILLND